MNYFNKNCVEHNFEKERIHCKVSQFYHGNTADQLICEQEFIEQFIKDIQKKIEEFNSPNYFEYNKKFKILKDELNMTLNKIEELERDSKVNWQYLKRTFLIFENLCSLIVFYNWNQFTHNGEYNMQGQKIGRWIKMDIWKNDKLNEQKYDD